MSPLFQIMLGLLLSVVTLFVHLSAINASLRHVKYRLSALRQDGTDLSKIAFIITSVLFLTLVICMEAVIWAAVFLQTQTVESFREGVYFSIVTLSTLGYGDIRPTEGTQLLAAICAVTGLFVMGLSTAFVVEILRTLQQDDTTQHH